MIGGEEKEQQVLGFGGVDMDLGMLLPHDNISFHASILGMTSLSKPHRTVAPSVILPEDAAEFHVALGYNSSEKFVSPHEGFFMVSMRGVTVVHDGVICNATHALTAMACKHKWHPPVHQMHGCQHDDDHPEIRVIGTSLLLIRYMGWFWGHFLQDVLPRLAFAVEYLELQQRGTTFNVIVESGTHGNVLALIQAMLGGNANSRVLFMPSSCLRGNARKCPYYFRPRELLLVEMFPKVVNILWTEDAVPAGVCLARHRVQSFFDD